MSIINQHHPDFLISSGHRRYRASGPIDDSIDNTTKIAIVELMVGDGWRGVLYPVAKVGCQIDFH